MLTTYLDVLNRVLERYAQATNLSRSLNGSGKCYYDHDTIPGSVGCGIGCLFTAPDAARIEIACSFVGLYDIDAIYTDRDIDPLIAKELDVEAIGIVNLKNLQRMHDGAVDVADFRKMVKSEIVARTTPPKILVNRTPAYDVRADHGMLVLSISPNLYGQWLEYDDGSREFDESYAQTHDIIQAEQYNGKAAKDDNGNWVPAPGPRLHERTDTINLDALVTFTVGLTFEGTIYNGKAQYDYTVITPTGVAFHGNGKDNLLHVPSFWEHDRVVLEMISWICEGEDSGIEFAEDTTPEQWQWIRSDEREYASMLVDEAIEAMDRGEQTSQENPVVWDAQAEKEGRDDDIEARAKEYQDRLVLKNQTSLVEWLLKPDSHNRALISFEDITNYMPDTSGMDATDLAKFLDEKMGKNWKDLIDIWDYIEIERDGNDVDVPSALRELDVRDLNEWDLEVLRDYIAENYEPREIFEWYLVDEWLANELKELGHPTVSDGSNHWWGRCTTGQAILMDGVLQQIAAKHI